jgi:hypothetical protein
MRAHSASAVLSLGALLLLAACEPDRKVLPRVAASPAAFVNSGFDVCDEEVGSNPSPRSVDGATMATLLHGTWVAQRTARDGRSMLPRLVQGREPDAHHILVLDTRAGAGLQFEERGPAVGSNVFAQMLAAPAGAPTMTYLHCGGRYYKAFRDRYTRVSNDPADGLRALARHTGYPIGEGSIGAAWQTLRDAGYLTGTPNGSLITAAFYSVSTGQTQRAGTTLTDARWDMVGEYRGSPAKFAHGQPATGMEGGVFQGVSTGQGSYVVGGDVSVACTGNVLQPGDTAVDTMSSGTTAANRRTYQQTAISYDRIVIGPFN